MIGDAVNEFERGKHLRFELQKRSGFEEDDKIHRIKCANE